MSQIASARPLSVHSSIPKLPQIEHPLARIGDPDRMDIRGMSRLGDRPISQLGSGRPLAMENEPVMSRLSSRATQRSNRLRQSSGPALGRISENMNPAQNGISKPATADSKKIAQIAAERLEIDELEMSLRERMKGGFAEMRKRFVDNDPELQGNVSKEGLMRIFISTLGRPITLAQLTKVAQRIGLRLDKPTISFTDFTNVFRVGQPAEPPKWIDTIQRNNIEKIKMSADEVHQQLHAKIKRRFIDVADVFPQFIDFGAGRILKPEFRNSLNKMLFFMDEEEFEKLWRRYDPENCGAINGVEMMKTMGMAMGEIEKFKALKRGVTPAKAEAERKKEVGIERWLKNKFREGFYAMKTKFEGEDSNGVGIVSHDTFLNILGCYGLVLEKRHLAEFLSRCNVTVRKDGVPYRDFLMRFQDRSEGGITHKILSKTKAKPADEEDPVKVQLSGLESQLMNMFQRDFLALLNSFQKFDIYGLGLLSQSDFRSAIEERFSLKLTDEQFNKFLENIPLSEGNEVKYSDFMKQFDTRGLEPSLFRERLFDTAAEGILNSLDEEPEIKLSPEPEELPARTVAETQRVLKHILNTRFQELDSAFMETEDYHSQRITQESFYDLFKKLNIQPEISKPEIRELWKTFILNDKQQLDYKEFLRTFMYNPNTSHYPNAKVIPPRKGDSDLMMRSRKLNCAADMLHDNLRMKIDYMWERIRAEFVEMDPYGTGYVSIEEFQEVMREICVQLQNHELETLTRKFMDKNDGRVNYVSLLRPFALKRQVWRNGSNMFHVLTHPRTPNQSTQTQNSTQKMPTKAAGPIAQLKLKLLDQAKAVRRSFKKLDTGNKGKISAAEFRSVMKLAGVTLDEEAVYHIMSHYDPKMEGTVEYGKFLSDVFGTQKGVKKA